MHLLCKPAMFEMLTQLESSIRKLQSMISFHLHLFFCTNLYYLEEEKGSNNKKLDRDAIRIGGGLDILVSNMLPSMDPFDATLQG